MKLHVYDVVIEPVITEKIAAQEESQRKYAFKVHCDANKKQIKSSIEKMFNVHVTDVNTMNKQGKWRRVRFQPGRTAAWKKAIVTLKAGEKIDITT